MKKKQIINTNNIYKSDENLGIKVKDLNFSILSRQILSNVSLHVEKNKIVGLIGPNGSGKTTLLKHIFRALPPEKNTVFINGTEIENYSYRETARQITVIRQENSSDFDYTVFEIVLMGRSPYRKLFEGDTNEDRQIAFNSLKFVGMDQYKDRAFETLSGGEKQRVLIARSLTQQADILILDEPTNHLDVRYQWALMDMIKNLGKTVIAVFHELNLACSFCDYLFVLKSGEIVSQGEPNRICNPSIFSEVFGVDVEIISKQNGAPYIIYNKAIQGNESE